MFSWNQTIYKIGSSLIYNTSARHERYECNTSETNAILVQHQRQECNTSETQTTIVRHGSYTNSTSATWTARVRNEWKILIL